MCKNYKLHGGKKEHLYMVWCTIKQRCLNPNNKQYSYYGGRGITICDEWVNDYSAFREWSTNNGYQKGLQIDRIDNDGNYEPSNCRWVDRKTQSNNKSSNILLSYNGKTQTLQQWSEETGISTDALYYRYHAGKSAEEILKKYNTNIGSTRVDITDDKVLELREQGMSIPKIAKALSCSQGTVYNRLKKLTEMKGE